MDSNRFPTLFTSYAPNETATKNSFTMDDGNARNEHGSSAQPIRVSNRIAKTYQVHFNQKEE